MEPFIFAPTLVMTSCCIEKENTFQTKNYNRFLFFVSAAASPLALTGPDDCPDLQLTRPGLPPYFEAPLLDPVGRPAKKQARAPRKGDVQ